MITDYLEIRNAEGMPKLVDGTMSLAFLLNSKSSVRNCAIALTEITSSEIRLVLRKQLNDAIATHETILNYMSKKGYYNPYDLKEQFQVDMKTSDTALNLVGKTM